MTACRLCFAGRSARRPASPGLGKEEGMRRALLVALPITLLGTLLTCGAVVVATPPQADPAPATATPDAAVAQLVRSTGASYAGDCATTSFPDDAGKVCSRFVAARGSVRAYLLGRT